MTPAMGNKILICFVLIVLYCTTIHSLKDTYRTEKGHTLFKLVKKGSAANNIYDAQWLSEKLEDNGTHPNEYMDSIGQSTEKSNSCILSVQEESERQFSHDVLKYQYNFVYLRLHFTNLSMNETKTIINGHDRIWTYKGENGAHQYLFLPLDFGYLSFGLLWSHTKLDPINIHIAEIGDCVNLKIGQLETDQLIGDALGKMTEHIAAKDDRYNSSYWCYYERSWIHSWFVYYGCKNAICTYQTVQYKCCKYKIDYVNKIRTVECNTESYKYATVWFLVPLIFGEICFAFYPVFLTKIGRIINRKIRPTTATRKKSKALTSMHRNQGLKQEDDDDFSIPDFISLRSSSPVSFLSSVCSPMYSLNYNRQPVLISRIFRIWMVFMPLTVSAIKVILDNTYAKELVKTAVDKGALLGFSSLIAGISKANHNFFTAFGGPVAALSIYISFGCLLIVFPSNLEALLERGLPSNNGRHLFLLTMPLKKRERFSDIFVRPYIGYRRMHNLFLAQIFMIFNTKYWKQAFHLFILRWRNVICAALKRKVRSAVMALLISLLVLPFYIVLCTLELLFSTIYFVFPVINCFFVLVKSYATIYLDYCLERGVIIKCMCYILLFPLFLLLCVSWYIYCVIFFNVIWFLSKIVMFTYSGIIAYPKLSYGYLVLAFMAIYYLTESVYAFGERYRELLKLSVEVCERYFAKHSEDSDFESAESARLYNKRGIRADLFYFIIERNLPRRNQVVVTCCKFASILVVLVVSVQLLITFDKFQELSVLSHVFTVLFICALPKIIKMVCMRNHHQRNRRKLRQRIRRTVAVYIESMKSRESDEDEEGLQFTMDGYESIGDDTEN